MRMLVKRKVEMIAEVEVEGTESEYDNEDTALQQELRALHPCAAEVHIQICKFSCTGRIGRLLHKTAFSGVIVKKILHSAWW